MTTGEPLIVRGAMKPLPTLTKPLRSVDIATKEPAAGAARAHRLVHRAGRRRRGGGDGGDRAGRAPTARSSAATTSTTCARRSAAYRERIDWRRWTGRPVSAEARALGCWSSSASWARASRPRRAGARRGAGRRGVDADRELERGWASRSTPSSTARASPRSARARRQVVAASCSTQGPERVVALGGGASASERVREALRAHRSCCSTSTPRRPGGAPRPAPGRSPATVSASTRCTRERAPLYEAVADAALLAGDRRCRAAPSPRSRAARGARRHAARVGGGRVGRVPGVRRRRPRVGRLLYPTEGRRFLVTDGHVARCTAASRREATDR